MHEDLSEHNAFARSPVGVDLLPTRLLYRNLEPYLISRLARASQSVAFYCPFVKLAAFERLFAAIPTGVSTSLVMRWNRSRFAAGTCDPGLYGYCSSEGIDLRRYDSLHLKICLIDGIELIPTSANISEQALVGPPGGNAEFMVTGMRASAADLETLAHIREAARIVSETDEEWASRIKPRVDSADNERSMGTEEEPALAQIPTSESPSQLWKQYRSTGADRHQDVELLGIPPGLDEAGFGTISRSAFLATPIVRDLTTRLRSQDLYFGELKRWLMDNCTDASTLTAQQITPFADRLLNWLEGLGRSKYRVERPRHSERLHYDTNADNEVLLYMPGIRGSRP